MKKFITSILTFIPLALVIYVALICVWGSNFPTRHRPNLIYQLGHWGHIFSRMKEVKTFEDVDILFLGSSHTYRGFDVRKFDFLGLKTFNLGTGAQTPIQTKALLKRYLPKLNPKTIIYEVSPILFSYEPVESSLDLIANDVNDIYTLEMIMYINHIKTYNTAIYSTYRDIMNLNKDFKENASRADDLYIPGGYVQRRMKRYKYRKHNKKERNPRSIQINAFHYNVQMIKDMGIKLILVQTPITQSLYEAHTSNEDFDQQMRVDVFNAALIEEIGHLF